MPRAVLDSIDMQGSMAVSPRYQVMNEGLTDTVMLLGMDDNLTKGEPRPVNDLKKMVKEMGRDPESPLLQALLEVYYAGGRDIWVVAVDDLSGYEPDLDERDSSYYQAWKDKLVDQFDDLTDLGVEDVVVPLDAPFNSSIDFLKPTLEYCLERYRRGGDIVQGFIGTRGRIDDEEAETLAQDGRLDTIRQTAEAGKFLTVMVGDVSLNLEEMPFGHTASVAPTAAGRSSRLPLDRGLVNRRLPNVNRIAGPILKSDTVSKLSQSGLNPVTTTSAGRRGEPFEVVLASDNTLALEGSDFWSYQQIRLASNISKEIKQLGNRRMGNVNFETFRSDVIDYLNFLENEDTIRDFQADISRSPTNPYRAKVDLLIRPYAGIRQIEIDIEVAPEEE